MTLCITLCPHVIGGVRQPHCCCMKLRVRWCERCQTWICREIYKEHHCIPMQVQANNASEAWQAYLRIERRYSEANRRLAESDQGKA